MSIINRVNPAVIASLVFLLLLSGCATTTTALWEYADPEERIWISARDLSVDTILNSGVDYEYAVGESGPGYWINQSELERWYKATLRAVGTPVTLVIDSALSTAAFAGYLLYYLFYYDPVGTTHLVIDILNQAL